MYHGDNPAAVRSQEWLCEALFEMMDRKPYADISITELCTKAGVSRQTFYQLFGDKTEIVYYYYDRIFRGYLNTMQKKKITLEDLIWEFYGMIENHEKELMLLVKNDIHFVGSKAFFSCLRELEKSLSIQDPPKMQHYLSEFLSGALGQLACGWLNSNKDLSRAEITSMTEYLLSGKWFFLSSNTNADNQPLQ